MPQRIYECPACGARSCKEIELNTFYCNLCDEQFDVEEMGFDNPDQHVPNGVDKDDE